VTSSAQRRQVRTEWRGRARQIDRSPRSARKETNEHSHAHTHGVASAAAPAVPVSQAAAKNALKLTSARLGLAATKLGADAGQKQKPTRHHVRISTRSGWGRRSSSASRQRSRELTAGCDAVAAETIGVRAGADRDPFTTDEGVNPPMNQPQVMFCLFTRSPTLAPVIEVLVAVLTVQSSFESSGRESPITVPLSTIPATFPVVAACVWPLIRLTGPGFSSSRYQSSGWLSVLRWCASSVGVV
jgi:hypothetical protein